METIEIIINGEKKYLSPLSSSSENKLRYNDNWYGIHDKPPYLFITDDGIKVTDENQQLYCLDISCFVGSWHKAGKDKKAYWHYFSTEQAAKNYIKKNKPCLSLKELKETAVALSSYAKYVPLVEIENLVNSKLDPK